MHTEELIAALVAWLITWAVGRWLPEADRNAIPTIAVVVATALVVAGKAAFDVWSGDALSWHTFRLGLTVGATAIVGHYGGARVREGVGFVVAWLARAKGKR